MTSLATRRARRAIAAGTTAATLAGMLALVAAAHGASIAPTAFPPGVALDSNAYALQFAGANREGTAAAIDLDAAISGSRNAGYPFSYSGGVAPKTDAAALYGPATCPTTLVLVADDTPADALSAASLRGLAALPVTDTSAKAVTFNTTHTALLLTESGRAGATELDATTLTALTRIKAACSNTIDGIILGGTLAVPDGAASAFAADVADVARLAGTDRFDTARQIGSAVEAGNTSANPARPALPTVNYYPLPTIPDAAFTNGAATPTATGQQALTRSVFLAEGQTGADALAVGSLAASLGVPILLTNSASLPQATQNALAALAPTHIVVLGGPSAISDAVVASAISAAGSGATSDRIAGANRYATSVTIAEQLFNLYPNYVTGGGVQAYADQLFGLARDEGSAGSGDHVGWPDALASAYYLADLSSTAVAAPKRQAPSVETSFTTNTDNLLAAGTGGACGSGNAHCYATYPLLLSTGSLLASDVDAYLKAIYPSSGTYRTGPASAGTQNDGGFGFVFGGAAAIAPATLQQLGSDLSGQTYTNAKASDLAPTQAGASAFFTTLNIGGTLSSPASGSTTALFDGGNNSQEKVCEAPGGFAGAVGALALDETGINSEPPVPVPYYSASNTPYGTGRSIGACVNVHAEAALANSADTVTFYGASLSGHETPAQSIVFPPSDRLSSTVASPKTDTVSGSVFGAIAGSGTSEQETVTGSSTADSVSYKGTAFGSASEQYSFVLTRTKGTNSQDLITWTGTLTATSGSTIFSASVSGGGCDATPASSGSVSGSITCIGVYSAPGHGALEFTLSPAPMLPPGGTDTLSNVAIDGLA